VVSAYDIPYERLYKSGIRGVIFDIDNTLVPHGAPADERAKKLFCNISYTVPQIIRISVGVSRTPLHAGNVFHSSNILCVIAGLCM